jgi:hypothetical protein
MNDALVSNGDRADGRAGSSTREKESGWVEGVERD